MNQSPSNPLDPNDLSRPNGNFFGFPYTVEESRVVFLPVPWDATTSYRAGAAKAPSAILQASLQVEWYDFHFPQAWQQKQGTVPINPEIEQKNRQIRPDVEYVIDYLEKGGHTQDSAIQSYLEQINQAGKDLNHWVYTQAKDLLSQNKLIGLVGGDHSVPLGLMQALGEIYPSYGILHLDAHADLRQGFEGFTYSHASIMYNALEITQISHLVQVGIRDVCEAEYDKIQQDPRIFAFDDGQLKANTYQGMRWAAQCEQIIEKLPENVYISFDIDGLDPAFCPNTGTPVPGGLDFNQAVYLIENLVKSGRKIISFDLCEVAPGVDQWDGNVAARLLYKVANLMLLSQ